MTQQLQWQGIPSPKHDGEPWQLLARRWPPDFLRAVIERSVQISDREGQDIPPQALLMTYALEYAKSHDPPLLLLYEKYKAQASQPKTGSPSADPSK